ncbi:hypothetical protein PVAP13_2KG049816 [Panicum virgatum]|uniref:Uncharacterized protein n=1 Tax=Panicum virgatum TaxID=38727 RepID=A0A8T0W1S1_PANVG|nr:hypothetical protein PVAP13_2KG049816 [Panicum virgatum]
MREPAAWACVPGCESESQPKNQGTPPPSRRQQRRLDLHSTVSNKAITLQIKISFFQIKAITLHGLRLHVHLIYTVVGFRSVRAMSASIQPVNAEVRIIINLKKIQ